MFDLDTIAATAEIANSLGWKPAALLAIAEVESGGKAFAIVDGRPEPLIRWEGHYFDRLLRGEARAKARAAGLAAPKAGAVPNPGAQQARWLLLARAIEIDAQAAYESCSWGVGQVMGSHWKALGFDAVTELVNLCRRDVAGQVELMARFIVTNGLAKDLARQDWAAFARRYNGPAYRKNAYDTKMAKAFARWTAKLGRLPQAGTTAEPPSRPTLRLGCTGEAVLKLQRMLAARGSAIIADGDFGPRTEQAVRALQETRGLTADGVVGARTWAALEG